jgi:hypothetical protein
MAQIRGPDPETIMIRGPDPWPRSLAQIRGPDPETITILGPDTWPRSVAQIRGPDPETIMIRGPDPETITLGDRFRLSKTVSSQLTNFSGFRPIFDYFTLSQVS